MDISTIDDIELETYITEVMLDIGVPAHLKGYYYLRDAIMMTGRDMDVVSSVTKLMYPVIARRFKTTDQKVERAIRNAIEVSWQRGNANTFAKLFGYSLQEGKRFQSRGRTAGNSGRDSYYQCHRGRDLLQVQQRDRVLSIETAQFHDHRQQERAGRLRVQGER